MRPGIMDRAAFGLLWLLVFTLPVEKSLEIPGIGTISKLVALPGFLFALLSVALRRQLRLPSPPLLAAAAWVLLSAFSRWWTVSIDFTAERTTMLVSLLLMVWTIQEICRTEDRARSLADAYVAGTVAAAVTAVVNYFTASAAVYQRYGAEGFDPNDFALGMALSIPFSYKRSLETGGAWPWFYRGQILLAAISILLSASRGGTMAMCVALSLVPLTFDSISRIARLGVCAAAVLAVLAAAIFVPATSWRRLATLSSEVSEGTLNSRTVLWAAGAEALKQSPLVGVGAGAFPEAVSEVMGRPRRWTPVAHNTFLSVLVETGALGFLIFFTLLVLLVSRALGLDGLDLRMWLVVLAVWTLGVMSLTWENRKPTWFVFGLLMATPAPLLRPQRSFAR